jgi:hypothetical protein
MQVMATRPTSELRSAARLLIVTRALGGEVLSPWWQPNWSAARSHVVSASGGWMDRDSHGERKGDGVHVWFAGEGKRYHGPPASVHEHNFEARVRRPDVVMPWSEVRQVVLGGATQERRTMYNHWYGEYCAHACKPLPHPIMRPGQLREHGLPDDHNDHHHPDNEAHWELGLEIHRGLNAAGYDILQAGVGLVVAKEQENEQMLLW